MFVKLHIASPQPLSQGEGIGRVVFYFVTQLINSIIALFSFSVIASITLPLRGSWRGPGGHLSISGITKSSVPIMATKSPSLLPLAMVSNAERLENPGERNLMR